jgi:YebC/PmpR family DNA-binding regulatory protein
MSGHSKWSTIKRQKGIADQKRGAVFTKLSNAITMAVKQGGGISDPNSNFRLRLAIDAARASNMPKDNIDRAIQRASGKDAGSVEEQVYEGFGPGGFSVIVEAVTDNKNRTSAEIRSIFDKNGGSFASPGAVSYLFESKGEIAVGKTQALDDVFVVAAESGADDIKETEDAFLVYTKPDDLSTVKNALESNNLTIFNAALIRKPTTERKVEREAYEKGMAFLQKLEDNDDVSNVFSNLEKL